MSGLFKRLSKPRRPVDPSVTPARASIPPPSAAHATGDRGLASVIGGAWATVTGAASKVHEPSGNGHPQADAVRDGGQAEGTEESRGGGLAGVWGVEGLPLVLFHEHASFIYSREKVRFRGETQWQMCECRARTHVDTHAHKCVNVCECMKERVPELTHRCVNVCECMKEGVLELTHRCVM